jgi:hypothetical protein
MSQYIIKKNQETRKYSQFQISNTGTNELWLHLTVDVG